MSVATESVRCLQCGCRYPKPLAGGLVAENPGCPRCDYIGWASADVAVNRRDEPPRRSGVGPPRHRGDRSR